MTREESFNSKKYWEDRYSNGGNSGTGSYNHLAEFKALTINNFIKKSQISKILEFGCGDGNNLSLYNINDYLGIDVSKKAINICKYKFKNDTSKKFLTLDDFKSKVIHSNLKVDLVLSLDVIYHLIEDDTYNEYMSNLFKYSSKYIIIYSSNYDHNLCSHVKHREFTKWIKKNKTNWFLKEFIKNPYPFDEKKPKDTTFADFYIFEKIKL